MLLILIDVIFFTKLFKLLVTLEDLSPVDCDSVQLVPNILKCCVIVILQGHVVQMCNRS
jgi:hypothetical protein